MNTGKTTDANYQDVPSIRRSESGRFWIVIGDPHGNGAHHWCNRRICKLYKTERGARTKYDQLLRAHARRHGAQPEHLTDRIAVR